MNKKTLVTLVKREARKLKNKATKEEINRLNFDTLCPTSAGACIYGQIANDCFSKRATQLISSRAERVYDLNGSSELTRAKINGRPFIDYEGKRASNYYSPIECFIWFKKNRDNGNNKILVSYLKGERKTLIFKKF